MLENLVHAMANRSRARMYLAAVLAGGIYTALSADSKIAYEDGGPEIENPLIVGSNPNITMASYYDQVPVQQTSELTTVLYNMTRMVGSLIISEQEEDENKGAAAIVKILKAKTMALELGFKRRLRTMAATVATGDEMLGLPDLFPSDPTSGTIGNQNLAAQPLFRPSSYDMDGGLTPDNFEEVIDDIEMDLTHEGMSPNMWFVGRNIQRMARTVIRDKSSINLDQTGFGKKLTNLGIKGFTLNGKPAIYDELLDPDTAYCINTELVRLHILKGSNMKVKKLTAPMDRDVTGRRFIFEGQICSWDNYRKAARLNA